MFSSGDRKHCNTPYIILYHEKVGVFNQSDHGVKCHLTELPCRSKSTSLCDAILVRFINQCGRTFIYHVFAIYGYVVKGVNWT